MKTLLLTLTYSVGIGELILAIYFWVTNSKSEIRKVMALLAFSTGMWVILSAATSYIVFSTTAYFALAAVYLFALFLVLLIFHLIIIMPYPITRIDNIHRFLYYILPASFFGFGLFFTRSILVKFTGDQNSNGTIIGGEFFNLYNAYLGIVFFSALTTLLFRIKKLSGTHRDSMVIVLWSILLGGLPGAIMYLIVPLFLGYLPYNSLLGVIPTVLWVGGTWYVIEKNKK